MTTTENSTPSLRLRPKGKSIIGRVVDFEESDGGITLVNGEIRNVTFFLLVDAVGSDVERCAVHDVICFFKANHIYTRAGHHFLVVDDEDVIAVVDGLDLERAFRGEGPIKVEGVPRAKNGAQARADA